MAETATGREAAREPQKPARDPVRDSRKAKDGKLRAVAKAIYGDDRKLQWALLVLMLLVYGALLLAAWGHSARTTSLRLTFNTMLDHMMRGQFDVDPQIVGNEEGFLRDGRVYSYFGIWCALLRLPLWIAGRMDADLTLWSCLAAACVAGMAKVRAVLLIRRHGMRNSTTQSAAGLMLVYVLAGGTGLGCLNACVYAEVIWWAYAFGAVFVYLAVKGAIQREFDLASLCWMALCAGLALNTRVTGGVGLILAFAFLLLALAAEPGADSATKRWPSMHGLLRAFTARRTMLPAGILATLVAVAGTVNFFRWGNPATFANWDLYLGAIRGWPDFLERMDAYGAFNAARIPFNLSYYFAPVWTMSGTNGDFVLNQKWAQTMISVELPPSSFFVSDLFAFGFIALLAIALWRRRPRSLPPMGRWAAAVATGLLAPCILMLMAPHATFRYRMEFYPEIDLLAFLGLYLTVTGESLLGKFARFRRWMGAALAISVAWSFVALVLLDVGQPLPPEPDPKGLVHYYYGQTAQHLHKIFPGYFPAD